MSEKLTLEEKLQEMIKAASNEGFIAGLKFANETIKSIIEEVEKKQGK